MRTTFSKFLNQKYGRRCRSRYPDLNSCHGWMDGYPVTGLFRVCPRHAICVVIRDVTDACAVGMPLGWGWGTSTTNSCSNVSLRSYCWRAASQIQSNVVVVGPTQGCHTCWSPGAEAWLPVATGCCAGRRRAGRRRSTSTGTMNTLLQRSMNLRRAHYWYVYMYLRIYI